MAKKSFYKIITFPVADTKNGTLTMFQPGDTATSPLPFPIKKVLVIKDMKESDERGGHTHHQTQQILIPLSGSCSVLLDNGKEKVTIKLDQPNQGLLLYPYVWHTMKDFTPGTILLVIADNEYDEKEYIRDYNEFLRHVTAKNIW